MQETGLLSMVSFEVATNQTFASQNMQHSLFILFLRIAVSVQPSLTSALSPAKNTFNLTNIESNLTAPTPLPPHPVHCLRNHRLMPLVPKDCAYIFNEIILKEDGVFEQRRFYYRSYRDSTGEYVASRWLYGQCEVFVRASAGAWQFLTFFDVALTANNIISKCVQLFVSPRGGDSLIGAEDMGFYVYVEGYPLKTDSLTLNNSSSEQMIDIS